MRIRQPTEIQTAFKAPTIPLMLKKGEKAKDVSVGAMVLLTREQIPKVAPKITPAQGPSKTAPKITGICTVVALIIGS